MKAFFVVFFMAFTASALFASSPQENKQRVQTLLHQLLESPTLDLRLIETYLTPDYRQYVNGEVLDYDGVVHHLKEQKKHLSHGRVTIERILAEGDDVVTVHTFEALKDEGAPVKYKVIAYFHLVDGRVSLVDELTSMVQGSPGDEDL